MQGKEEESVLWGQRSRESGRKSTWREWGVQGLCWHLGRPQAGSCCSASAPWGSSLPEPGGQQRRWNQSHQPFTARGVLAPSSSQQLHVGAQAGSCCVCPWLEGAGAMSGVWDSNGS